MLITSVVGARPQFVKAAVMCHAILEALPGVKHRLIHTGQHYDRQMSQIFFDELGIPEPDTNLGVGSGTHGEQTGEMLKRLEAALVSEKPDWLVLYGDTNSTLAGAITASKLHIPAAHIEAGLRSFNRRMPEEINRVVTDHLAELLFCPTAAAQENLRREGLESRTVMTGDVMFDAALLFRRRAEERESALAGTWKPSEFALATVHRADNTDDPERLLGIVQALERISSGICPVLFPVHPRTRRSLSALGWTPTAITLTDPLSYLDMLLLEGRARMILTDSGGVQKEAYFFQKPCITLRDETEWVETLENHCNVLTGASRQNIVSAAGRVGEAGPWKQRYGDGRAGYAIARVLSGLKPASSSTEAGV